ncbi:MAG: hypothetical protein E7020_02085 [Alphaproteobacteria bacterium]|nr:hypothetical protein [Alphaproteobacteria bacterium]
MVNSRMVMIENEQQIANVEMAHFIMLSLYREYSKLMLKNPQDKDDYIKKMRQIKYDMRHLLRKELIIKANSLYKPILQKLEGKTPWTQQ